MMFIGNLFANGWANALGWTLLHSLWQSLLILLIIVAVLRVVDSRRSALRYALTCAGYFVFTVSALATFFYLRSNYVPAASPASAFAAPAGYVVSPVVATQPSTDFISAARLTAQTYMPVFLIIWAVGFFIFTIRLCAG